jgi:transposase
VQALGRIEPITRLAQRHDVSRKFVYQQVEKATNALDQAFQRRPSAESKVLFWLPVSKDWLEQLVLSLTLICHSSYRGVMELLDTMFDYRQISLGGIHNLLQRAVEKAQNLNDAEDLSAIHVGAHDEIYQAGQPVLVGMDVVSTYCYLLEAAEHCDETTWGVHLLEQMDHGLHLDYTIADAGQALRAGQKAAWGALPCHGDVFHAEKSLNEVAWFLARRARACTLVCQKIERKYQQIERACKRQTLGRKLSLARREQQKALALAADIRVLADWMGQDVLALAGGRLAEREELYDFIVMELQQRQGLCPHRIGPVVRTLRNQRTRLLAFVEVLQEKFSDIARRFGVSLSTVQALCEVEALDQRTALYWQRTAQIQTRLKGRGYRVQQAVLEAMAQTPRASSMVENLNSRLRNYFFLRRQIGHGYLHLLRFFLNHRCFLRSDRPERVGKSPAELLAGHAHPHWLEMLGYTRFHRN